MSGVRSVTAIATAVTLGTMAYLHAQPTPQGLPDDSATGYIAPMAGWFEIDLRHRATGRQVTVRQDRDNRLTPLTGFDAELPWDERAIASSLSGAPGAPFEIVGDPRIMRDRDP
jgi:hypothetical protein